MWERALRSLCDRRSSASSARTSRLPSSSARSWEPSIDVVYQGVSTQLVVQTDAGTTLVAFHQNSERVSDAGVPGARIRLVWDPVFNVVLGRRARTRTGAERMSEPDRVSLAFIWDTDSPRFSRRTFMKTMGFAAAAGFARRVRSSSSGERRHDKKAEPKTLNFYNWTDYIADDTIPNFQKETGIKVTYDNYSSNDELFAKMSAGSTGYDIIVPTDATLVKMKHANLVRAARPLDHPERRQSRPALSHRRVRPGQPVLDPVAVGHDRHRLRQDQGRRHRHRLGRVQAARDQGQVVVSRRSARRVRDGVVRVEEGSEHHRRRRTSTTRRTTSST